jgi:hypothetical protein
MLLSRFHDRTARYDFLELVVCVSQILSFYGFVSMWTYILTQCVTSHFNIPRTMVMLVTDVMVYISVCKGYLMADVLIKV